MKKVKLKTKPEDQKKKKSNQLLTTRFLYQYESKLVTWNTFRVKMGHQFIADPQYGWFSQIVFI